MKNYKSPLMFIVMFVGLVYSAYAQTIPPVIPNTYVQDHANVLNDVDKATLQNQLTALKTKYNLEVGVATVETTGNYDIFNYSLAMARAYGVGSKDNEKRGILLVLATKDRKWFMQVSRHMEGVLTDGQAGSIGRSALVPKLKTASTTGKSADWLAAMTSTLALLDTTIAKNIEPEVVEPKPPTDYTMLWTALVGTIFAGGGFGIFAIFRARRRAREEEQERAEYEAQLAERRRLRDIEIEKEQEEMRKAAEAHAAYLKTPEGKAETARIKKEKAERIAAERKAAEERRLWLLTPEGIAYTAEQKRLDKEKKEAERTRRIAEEEESNRRSRSSYSSSSSYSSNYDSGSSSSGYDSGSSGGGFSGGGDFGGGGGGGSW